MKGLARVFPNPAVQDRARGFVHGSGRPGFLVVVFGAVRPGVRGLIWTRG